MKERNAYVISTILAGLLISVTFAGPFLAVMYSIAYLLPDHPGTALFSGLVSGICAVWVLGIVARRDNEKH